MRRDHFGTALLTLLAGALAVGAMFLVLERHNDHWFTPANRETQPFTPAFRAMFFTAMFVFAVAGVRSRRVYAQPVLAAGIVTAGAVVAFLFAGGLALGVSMSGGSGADGARAMMLAAAGVAAVVAVIAIASLPIRGEKSNAAAIQAAIAGITPKVNKAIGPGDSNRPRAARWTGRHQQASYELFVYPRYSSTWTNVICPPV